MQEGKVECTHDFYLKLFHLLLVSGVINYDNFDLIMLDEAGDLNPVTMEIFKLLPATHKIAVGDQHQNIYRFNHTINCFDLLDGKSFKLTQSFRTEHDIAKRIERFGKSYFSKDFSFRGIHHENQSITTRAYLTRTNAALVHKMIELNASATPYSLVRKASEIFKLPLMLCGLKPGGFIANPAYKHLQADVDYWAANDDLRLQYRSPISYIGSLYDEDPQLTQAIRLVNKYSRGVIMSAYNEAHRHEKSPQALTLCTVHSSKGLEFDEVVIATDLNESIVEIIANDGAGTPDEVESLNLYYVACTRALKLLHNAVHL